MQTIIVPVDGATNIKCEVLNFSTLSTIATRTAETPAASVDGRDCNLFGEECLWFDRAVGEMVDCLQNVRVVAPVARGASGGFIGPDNRLAEIPGRDVCLAYTQAYPDRVEERFRELAGDERDFFLETGSIRDFPGSLTLIKRFLYEEMERPEVVARSERFATYGALLAGHFLGDDLLLAARLAGNEHSYWMCHTGARDINGPSGAASAVSRKIQSFARMVPDEASRPYLAIGRVPPDMAGRLGVCGDLLVVPGGHDTCLSHLPIMSTFYQSFTDRAATPVIHVEAGSWTMIARIGGKPVLPPDGYRRDIIVQGTVDGQPVVTARYGGGNDYRHLKRLAGERGMALAPCENDGMLGETARSATCFVLPNISPVNHKTGPFPRVRGRIIGEAEFFADNQRMCIVANLCTSIVTACQVEAVAGDPGLPIVVTAGGSKDPLYGRLLATFTGRTVFAMEDSEGRAITETTTLGAAINGKAACLKMHPYRVDVSGLGVRYRELRPYDGDLKTGLMGYRDAFMARVRDADKE